MNLGQAITKSEIDVFDTLLDVHDTMPISAQNEILEAAMKMQATLVDLSISEVIAIIGMSMSIELSEQAGLTFNDGASK